jgi:hypothetical protein
MGLLKLAGNLLGGNKKKKASKKAVAAFETGGNLAIGTFNNAQTAAETEFAPFKTAGTTALSKLQDMLYGNPQQQLENDPDYNYRLSQGVKAREQSAAARGSLFSGDTLKAITRFGQNEGAKAFGTRYDRLRDLSGLGYNATGAVADSRLRTAGAVGDTQMDIANAKAGGILQRGNISANQISSIGNWADNAVKNGVKAFAGGI